MGRFTRGATLLALLSCDDPPPTITPGPLTQPEVRLGASTPTTRWRGLDALDSATITLPDVSSNTAFDGTFVLSDTWKSGAERVGRLQVFVQPLPFVEPAPRPNYAPWGARLYADGQEIPYANDVTQLDIAGWFVEDGNLVVIALEEPRGATLVVEELAQRVRALDPVRSGLTPAQFVRSVAEIGPRTRPALHLPAPASIQFGVTIPADARLDFGAALVQLPLATVSDGAVVRVEVDGEEIWKSRLDPGEAPVEADVSLKDYAGREVQLRFITEPRDNNAHDYVMITAPVIHSAEDGAGGKRAPRHLVLVGIDTLRYDGLSVHGYKKPTSPELDAWTQNAYIFDQSWAPAPRTRPSFRTILTGRYPLSAPSAPSIAEVLSAAGFRTAGFTANVHLVPRFGFNRGFEEWYYENGARADVQGARALQWMREHEDEDTFVFLHLMDPHTNYNAPEPFNSRFVEGERSPELSPQFNRWEVYRLMRTHKITRPIQAHIRSLYDGEVAWVSDQLTRTLVAMEGLSGQMLSVIVSDHGEEFWDHGGYEHNHSTYDELIRSVFWVRPPAGWGGGPHRLDVPVGLIDVTPTMLDFAEVPATIRPETDGLSLRPLLDAGQAGVASALREQLQARPLYAGHLMFERDRWAVMFEGWKYILHTSTGEEQLFELSGDPDELNERMDDAGPERIASMRAALGQATGWPVRPGWRIRLGGDPGERLQIVFEAPIERAGIIDPEADAFKRANLEWGEVPEIRVEEVGTVTVSEDRKTVELVTALKAPNQVIFIACEGACPIGVVRVGGEEAPLRPGNLGVRSFRAMASPGTLLLPTVTEADVLAGTTDASQREALEHLGYLHKD